MFLRHLPFNKNKMQYGSSINVFLGYASQQRIFVLMFLAKTLSFLAMSFSMKTTFFSLVYNLINLVTLVHHIDLIHVFLPIHVSIDYVHYSNPTILTIYCPSPSPNVASSHPFVSTPLSTDPLSPSFSLHLSTSQPFLDNSSSQSIHHTSNAFSLQYMRLRILLLFL